MLGRNGAGKSTLIKIINNYTHATDGEVLIDKQSAHENDTALSKMYVMSPDNYYPPKMKVKDIFKWTKAFYPSFNMERAYDYAEKFQLDTNAKFKSLSTGYNSIMKIIIALNIGVPFVIYDEPILGLDANHRDMFYKLLLKGYEQVPHTIVIATHLIEEIAHIIEHVVIIEKGRILLDEPVEKVLNKGYSVSGEEQAVNAYITDKEVLDTESIGGLKVAYLLGEIDKNTIPETLNVSSLSLQKFFVKLTERGALYYESKRVDKIRRFAMP